MPACKPLVFTGISMQRFQAIRARIRAQAEEIKVDGDQGNVSGNGYSATWNYDQATQALTIQCTNKPFFAPESLVADKITALVTSL